MTLRSYLEYINDNNEEATLCLRGIGSIDISSPLLLTEEGEEYFGSVLDMDVYNNTVIGTDQDNEDLRIFQDEKKGNGGRLMQVWELLSVLSGYCPSDEYSRFVEHP